MLQILSNILQGRHRHVIHAVVEEISVKPATDSLALKIMPMTNVPFATLEHEVISASGGRTAERVVGEEGKSVSGPSSTSLIYKPGAYQDTSKFGEKELLGLRKLGTLGDRGASGLTGGELNWINRIANKLKLRLNNRLISLAWTTIFTGKYTYKGIETDFEIPAGNFLTAATDWSVAAVGTPFEDLIVLLDQNPTLIKYRALVKGLVINPKTAADILMRALESKVILNANVTSGGINEVKKFMAPGLPDFIVVADAMQEESEDADGKITLADAAYLVPNDKVFVLLDLGGADVLYPMYGELQLTENMNDPSATVESPAVGIYTFIDEEGLKKRKSPYVEVVAGFNGGPNLMRPKEVFVISC